MVPLLDQGVLLLIVAVLVALSARALRLPYTVGLVAVGMGLTALPGAFHVGLTHDFVYEFILPPLLFEAAINIHWRELQQDFAPILTLAVLGTLVAAVCVTLGMHLALGWQLQSAAMFGILIAATDPVAVIAMFKDNGIGGRLRLLTESESLFNDGVAAVLFAIALGWAATPGAAGVSAGAVAGDLALSVGGGILTGVVCGAAALAIAGRTADHLVESTITTVTAYGAFQVAEHLGCSGVLATICAGLMIGNFGVLAAEDHSRLSAEGRRFVLALWEFIAFVANSVIFLLIGMTTAKIPFRDLGAAGMASVIALVLASRAAAVYPLCLAFRRSRAEVGMREQHVLWWGGLRGALGLALALALPEGLPLRNEILIATFGVVAFSVLVQGITMPVLLRVLRFVGPAKNPG